jgi:tetratricopeptide (TPR) repeat protein
MARILLVGCLLLCPLALRADVIHLRNGNEISGRIIGETEDSIRLEIPFGTQTIHRQDIARIQRESDLEYYLRQGDDLLERGSADGALLQFQEAFRHDPTSREALRGIAASHLAIGRSLLDDRRLTDAMDAFQRSIDIDPAGGEEASTWKDHAAKVIAMVDGMEADAARTEDPAGRVRLLREAIALCPLRRSRLAEPLGDALAMSAHRLCEEGKYREAAPLYDLALRNHPDLVGTLAEIRVYCHLQSAETEPARSLVEGLQFFAPHDRRIAFALGRIEQEEGNLVQARDAFLRVLGRSSAPEDPTDLARLRSEAEAALGPPPPPVREDGDEPEEAGSGWELLHLGSIRIHHRQPEVARRVALSVEHYVRALPGHISRGPRPDPVDLDIWVYPDTRSFRADGGRGEASLEIRTEGGDVLERTIRLDASRPQAFPCNLAREMGRILHLSLQGYRRVHPDWVEEGIAARCEPAFKRLWYLDRVADIFRRGDPDPLARLIRGGRITGEEDRALASAIVEYLVELRGLEHFSIAIDDLMRFRPDAFLRVRYGIEREQELTYRLREWVLSRSPVEEEEK